MQNVVKEAREQSHSGDLPAIPTPAGTRWREFRVRYVPIFVFALTAFLIWQFWSDLPPATGIRGIGEGPVSLLASPADGFLQNVVVEPRGRVEAGKPIATIVPFDPRSRMDMFQAQLQISRLALEPSIVDRNVMNYEQLRIDALQLRSALAMAKANLQTAEEILPRHEKALKDRLISQDIYAETLRNRNFYRAEVENTSRALQDIEARLKQLAPMGDPTLTATNLVDDSLLPRLEEQMVTIQTNFHPITLTAPISGEVNYYRQAREFVAVGEPLLTINSERADRIIAYLKQPLPFEPQVGMQMEVVTRSRNPQRFITEIANIGARVEVITNSIAYLQPGTLVDSGLPLILPVPPDVHIRPGEIVDVEPKETGGVSLIGRLFGKR